MNTIVMLVIILLVVGVALYLINNFIPMDPKIKQLLNVLVIVMLVIWIIVKFLLPMARGA
jgi:hypothetical protein